MELKMMFYLSNVAIAVNISQPSVRIGGGLHALIHIIFLHGGLKAPNHFGTLTYGKNLCHVRSTAGKITQETRTQDQARGG